jgi:hypothetical protein
VKILKTEEENREGEIRASDAGQFLDTLVQVGANPFRQVISGAGLCLSDGAILDLPPYSNMRQNVMWIDDHLKYALHDELGHFGRWTRTHHLYESRVSESRFQQIRHARRKNRPLFSYADVRWHNNTYMLRLILGCVADSWLRGRSEIKQGTQKLRKRKYQELLGSVPHIFGDNFLDVIPGGWESFANTAKADQFRQVLWEEGCKRLRKIVKLWGAPRYHNTYLGLFILGKDHPRYAEFRQFLPKGISKGLNSAVTKLPKRFIKAKQITQNKDLRNPTLDQALVLLIDDFVNYLSLVQFWPLFVQSVRCLQNQHAQYQSKSLEWMFPSME